MQIVYMMKGLPASGKSTYAKEMVEKAQGKLKRINKDDLRDMIDGGRWSKEREKGIIKMRDESIRNWLNNGYDVIVDDTNLAPKHIERINQIVDIYNKDNGFIKNRVGAIVEVIDLTEIPLYECLKRDAKREKSIGVEVITKMYFQFLFNKTAWTKPIEYEANVIIVDLDGTLAINQGRSPFDASKYEEDGFNYNLWNLVKAQNIVFLSGREGTAEARKATENWLKKYTGVSDFVLSNRLFMRKEGDSRKDSTIKAEIYENEIKPNYYVIACYDDRDQVVDMWRSKGILCCQVNYGGF